MCCVWALCIFLMCIHRTLQWVFPFLLKFSSVAWYGKCFPFYQWGPFSSGFFCLGNRNQLSFKSIFEAERGNMFAQLGDLLQYLLQKYTVWEILRLFSVNHNIRIYGVIDNLIVDEIKEKETKRNLKKGKKLSGSIFPTFATFLAAVCDWACRY